MRGRQKAMWDWRHGISTNLRPKTRCRTLPELEVHGYRPIHQIHQPISQRASCCLHKLAEHRPTTACPRSLVSKIAALRRSEEHTSELQSRLHLVCRLLLEKKKRQQHHNSVNFAYDLLSYA